MIIEILYPEHVNLFGDMSNMRYLQACLPDAEFIRTPLTEVPYFVNHKVDLLYMGPMTERTQQRVILALMPFADRLSEMIDNGTPMLFTGNAMEVLGHNIQLESGNSIHGLGLLPMNAKQDMFHRYNGLVLGHFSPIEADIVGLLISATEDYSLFPPCVTCMVNREVIGVVTKKNKGNPERAERWLRLSGCKTVFFVDSKTREGVEEILKHLKNNTKPKK